MRFPHLELFAVRAFARAAGVLPWGAGQYRLASRYAALGRWPAGFLAIQRLRSGATVSLDLGDRLQLITFLVRDYSPALTKYIVSRLPAGGTFLDVGGNVGLITFTVAASRSDVTIHALEPNPTNAEAWRRNQQLNNATSAHLAMVGASDREGDASFSVPSDSSSGMIQDAGGLTIPLTTLDRHCSQSGLTHIDVLKIDVEGHEHAVLRGAADLLSAGAVTTILCEISEPLLRMAGTNKDAVFRLLTDHGFQMVHLPPVGLRRLLRGARGSNDDVVFERPSRTIAPVPLSR